MIPAAIALWWGRANTAWAARSRREQLLLGTFAVLAIIALTLLAVIRPLQAARADALVELRDANRLIARVAAAGPTLATQTRMREGTPSAIVTASVAAAGLSVQRIEPEGGRLRVVLGDAPFDALLRWIADLETTSGLRVVEARIERRTAPGMVSAQMLVG